MAQRHAIKKGEMPFKEVCLPNRGHETLQAPHSMAQTVRRSPSAVIGRKDNTQSSWMEHLTTFSISTAEERRCASSELMSAKRLGDC